MVCTFFGHKQLLCNIESSLEKAILNMVNVNKVYTFYVGNNGLFDCLVQKTLCKLALNGLNIKYYVILSRVNEVAIGGEQDKTLFPEELEHSLPRFAINKRNFWLINNSHYVIAYVRDKYSNSYKWKQKALNKGLSVINI